MRKTVRYILTDYKINKEMAKELNITPVLDKIQDYRIIGIRRVNIKGRKRLPRIIENYIPKGRRNKGGRLKRTVDV